MIFKTQISSAKSNSALRSIEMVSVWAKFEWSKIKMKIVELLTY